MAESYFRAKAQLESGERIYDSCGSSVVCYPESDRPRIEAIKQALRDRHDYAYSPALHEFRPAWCFPRNTEVKRVVAYLFEDAHEPLDESALLPTGENAGHCPLRFLGGKQEGLDHAPL